MIVYFYIIAWAAVVGLVSKGTEVDELSFDGKTYVKRTSRLYALLIMGALIFMFGLRSGIGDTPAYITSFENMPSEPELIGEYMEEITKYPAFAYLSCLWKCYISDDYHSWLFVIALISGVGIMIPFRRHSENYWVTVLLFILGGTALWFLNGIKQFLVCAIIFAFTDLLLKKKYIAYIIVVLLASRMHTTGLIMIPMIVIAQGKPWSWKMGITMALGFLAIVFVDVFADISSFFLEDTIYSGKEERIFAGGEAGANILRFVFTALVPVSAFILKKKIDEIATPIINLCINLSVVTAGIYLISSFTSGVYMGRMPIYTVCYNYILIPWIITKCFNKKTQVLLWVAVIAVFGVYFYFETSGFAMPYYSDVLDIYIS